jgi:uncharacterized protein (TIGR02996 family)
MSPEEMAFLRAIDATPEDDVPRLVYADWLDDRGHSIRAEFIRLQCEIAKLEVGPREIVDANYRLWKRQQELMDSHYLALMGQLAYQYSSAQVTLSRGFVSEVHLDVHQFVQNEVPLARLLPRPLIRVRHVTLDITGFLCSSSLELVTAITLLDPRATVQPELFQGDSGLYPLLSEALPRLIRLQELNLSGCGLGDDGMRFFELAEFPQLRNIDLTLNNVSDEGVIYLLNRGLLQRLEIIVLTGNPIGDQCAIELADRLGRSTKLRHLNLRATHIQRQGQQALLSRFGSRVDLF